MFVLFGLDIKIKHFNKSFLSSKFVENTKMNHFVLQSGCFFVGTRNSGNSEVFIQYYERFNDHKRNNNWIKSSEKVITQINRIWNRNDALNVQSNE